MGGLGSDALDKALTKVFLCVFDPLLCPPLPPPSPSLPLLSSQMALWEKSMSLQGPLLEQLKALYGHRLPIEVRHYLANWMEVQSW